MKKAFLVLPLVLVLALTSTTFGQQDKVSNTPHNLNTWAGPGAPLDISTLRGANQVCLPCHVPHHAYPDLDGTIEDVLWNHMETEATFTMYTTERNPTVGQPEGASRMCLSCHDGVIALDSYGTNTPTPTAVLSGRPTGVGEVVGGQGDLSNDHPIGIVYPEGEDGYNASSGFTGVQLVKVGTVENRVECTSCHDPHNNGLSGFLRRELNNSYICLECHDK